MLKSEMRWAVLHLLRRPDPGVIGAAVRINGGSYPLVGVGSTAGGIARCLLRRTVLWLLLGAGVGLALGQLASIAPGELLFGVGGGDVYALAAVLAAFALMAIVAIALPPARALRLEPMEALRYD